MTSLQMSSLNPTYTLESFVTGDENILAHRAITRLSERSNLLITGAYGTGKTHLLHAAGQLLRQQGRNPLLYTGKPPNTQFDALLIDDLQRYDHNPNLLDIMEYAHSESYPIIFTRRNTATPLSTNLTAALSHVVSIYLDSPQIGSKLKRDIVDNISNRYNLTLPEETLEYLTQSVVSHWNLEPLLINMAARCIVRKLVPDVRVATEFNDKYNKIPPESLSGNDIIRVVAQAHAVTPEQILSKRRIQLIVEPRHIGMYITRIITRLSFPEIAKSIQC